MKRVAIVGLGLIGGSLALALRRAGNVYVTAVDRGEALARAEARKAADEHLPIDDAEGIRAALERSDVTVLAVPVGTIIRLLPWSLAHAPVVTDCGSTKREVAAAALEHSRGSRFVPGHPMAGLPDGGVENARADLFEGRSWILCPEHCDADALQAVQSLVAPTGAHIVSMNAAEHDRAVAMTSHLPQLIASALFTLPGADENIASAIGPAFERVTRGAGGLESMWADIFETNSEEVARAVEKLCAKLGQVAGGLRRTPPDIKEALALLSEARERRQR
jgi:prephenate dehydrogenase